MDGRSEDESAHFRLSNLYLKQIVKENHAHTIKQLKFSEIHPNLLASVGGTQASIYDNQNAGNHFDIMVNFVNMDTPALLRVLTSCEAAIAKRPILANHAPPGDPNPSEMEAMDVSPVMDGTLPTVGSLPMSISDESKLQINAMRAVVEEGGFDDDIHVGAKEFGLLHASVTVLNGSSDIGAVENGKGSGNETSLSTLPSSSSVDIMPNRRLMQGVGRDIELFDRSDRTLNTCAWVAFPPRVFLTSVQIEALSACIHDSKATKKYHGASDVDTSRVDRTDSWLAVAGADGLVQLLSVAYCKSVYVLPGHCEPILALASGRSGTCLASLSQNFIILWNLPLLARHHYNSFHYGGPGLDQIIERTADWERAKTKLPFPINQLPTEHTRWILQVIPTPSRLLTMLEFTQFGLVAAASSGHLYSWPFASQTLSSVSVLPTSPITSSCVDIDTSYSSQEFHETSFTMDDLGPRQQPAKRNAPGLPPMIPIWATLPTNVVDADMCRFLDWPHHGEQVCALAKVHSDLRPDLPGPALAVRTSTNRLVVFAPIPLDLREVTPHGLPPSTEPKLQMVNLLLDFRIPVHASSNGLQTTFNPSGKLTTDESYELRQRKRTNNQSLAVSACGKFALLGDSNGDAYLVDIAAGSLLSKLEHKRSKANVNACVIAHHSNNVAFSSDAMLWRWDFISPAFLHKERAEQARAEVEGVDIPQYEPEDDAPDDVI